MRGRGAGKAHERAALRISLVEAYSKQRVRTALRASTCQAVIYSTRARSKHRISLVEACSKQRAKIMRAPHADMIESTQARTKTHKELQKPTVGATFARCAEKLYNSRIFTAISFIFYHFPQKACQKEKAPKFGAFSIPLSLISTIFGHFPRIFVIFRPYRNKARTFPPR